MTIQACQNFCNDLYQFCTAAPIEIRAVSNPNDPIIEIAPNTHSMLSHRPLERYVLADNFSGGYVNYSSLNEYTSRNPLFPGTEFLIQRIEEQQPLLYRKVNIWEILNPSIQTLMRSPLKRAVAFNINCLHWTTFALLKTISFIGQMVLYTLTDVPSNVLRWTTKMVISIIVGPFATTYIGFSTYEFEDATQRNQRMEEVSRWINNLIPSMDFFKGAVVGATMVLATMAAVSVIVLPSNLVFLLCLVAITTSVTKVFPELTPEKIEISEPQITPGQVWSNSLRRAHWYTISQFRDEASRQTYLALRDNMTPMAALSALAQVDPVARNVMIIVPRDVNGNVDRDEYNEIIARGRSDLMRSLNRRYLRWDIPQFPIERLP